MIIEIYRGFAHTPSGPAEVYLFERPAPRTEFEAADQSSDEVIRVEAPDGSHLQHAADSDGNPTILLMIPHCPVPPMTAWAAVKHSEDGRHGLSRLPAS